jgi:hypothetical protein
MKIAFYTCFFGADSNERNKIPPCPKSSDCFFFTNNPNTYRDLENTDWNAIFVNTPVNGSVPIVFDPRPGKKQISMRQINQEEITFASEQIMLEVKAGDFMFFNSWLPHGFTRHESDEPFQFIHFNVCVEDALTPNVEIV